MNFNFERIKKSRAGMTFVELLVAMVLFTLLMWPMYQIFVLSARGSMRTGDVTVAINVATEIIELLKNKPFDALTMQDPKSLLKPVMEEKEVAELLGKSFNNKFPTDAGRFIRQVEITPLQQVATARGKEFTYVQIVVNVYWTDKLGRSKGPISLFALAPNENMAFK